MAVLGASFLWPICVLGAEKQQETMRGVVDTSAVRKAAFPHCRTGQENHKYRSPYYNKWHPSTYQSSSKSRQQSVLGVGVSVPFQVCYYQFLSVLFLLNGWFAPQ